GSDCFIPTQPPREAIEARPRRANQAAPGDHYHSVPRSRCRREGGKGDIHLFASQKDECPLSPPAVDATDALTSKRLTSAGVDRSRPEDGPWRYGPGRAAPLSWGSTRGTSAAEGRTSRPFQPGMVSSILAFPWPASSGTRTRPANRTNPCRRASPTLERIGSPPGLPGGNSTWALGERSRGTQSSSTR